MAEVKISPKVTAFSWGKVEVEGYSTVFKDVKLYPGGVHEWDWSITGTRHNPGIQPADVEEILAAGATIVILSKGVEERLGCKPETLDYLRERGVTYHILQTERAIEKYNELAGREAVGALIHSTC